MGSQPSLRETIRQLHQEIEEAKRELAETQRLFAAAVVDYGGELRISLRTIERMRSGGQLCWYRTPASGPGHWVFTVKEDS